MDTVKRIPFYNTNHPDSHFDLIRLEELLQQEAEDHITHLHKIDFYLILIITEGSGFHTIDFTDYSYEKGTLITIRKDQLQQFFSSPNVKGHLLLFTEDFLASHFSEVEVLKSFQLFNELLTLPKIQLSDADYHDLLSLVKNIEAEYQESYDEFSVGIIRSAMHMLIIKLFRIKTKNSHVFLQKKYFDEFTQFQKLVEQHCFTTKKVLDYAQMMHCTTKTLNNITKAILNKSAKMVVDEILMTQIKRLLINTTESITEIAYQSGFEDPTNFYKYFKKFTQVSPEAFRKAHL